MADNEDVKAQMRAALDAKKQKSSSTPKHGSNTTSSAAHDHSDREGGKREFRRKSGG